MSATERNVISPHGKKKRRRASSCKKLLLNGCNSLLTAYQNDFDLRGLRVDFSTNQNSSQLNGFFTSADVKGMLEGKDYSAIDTVFSFIAAFIDHVTESKDNPVLTRIHTMYSDIVNRLLYPNCMSRL